ncbi:hypothetical protein M3Y94_00864600 [Aphelenchoides besseyi]|nr:hypothetical protein M3Y94_00864600 [Aphelenchoides besseyi]KAI6226713.1 hypothetical protein M3Y95_00649800 [Aphelenchoides besseyi]
MSENGELISRLLDLSFFLTMMLNWTGVVVAICVKTRQRQRTTPLNGQSAQLPSARVLAAKQKLKSQEKVQLIPEEQSSGLPDGLTEPPRLVIRPSSLQSDVLKTGSKETFVKSKEPIRVARKKVEEVKSKNRSVDASVKMDKTQSERSGRVSGSKKAKDDSVRFDRTQSDRSERKDPPKAVKSKIKGIDEAPPPSRRSKKQQQEEDLLQMRRQILNRIKTANEERSNKTEEDKTEKKVRGFSEHIESRRSRSVEKRKERVGKKSTKQDDSSRRSSKTPLSSRTTTPSTKAKSSGRPSTHKRSSNNHSTRSHSTHTSTRSKTVSIDHESRSKSKTSPSKTKTSPSKTSKVKSSVRSTKKHK